MALRRIEISVIADDADELRELLEGQELGRAWRERTGDQDELDATLIVDAEHTGPILDAIQDQFQDRDGFEMAVVEVAAVFPPIERVEEEREQGDEPSDGERATKLGPRGISREELMNDVVDMMKLSRLFIILVVLSSIVASIGVIRDDLAVIIGAMVIAPLLGPNVALAFGTTLGDLKLMRNAVVSNLAGMGVAIGVAALLGWILAVEPITPRSNLGLVDLALALGAGAAGTLAITTATPTALVGVMVAVALLPPTVVTGLMIGAGHWSEAVSSGILVTVNVVAINLASVVMFLFQGVRPLTWGEADKAKRSTWIAITIWTLLLIALGVLISLMGD